MRYLANVVLFFLNYGRT